MDNIVCYFDGCCEPINPGGTASYGAVIFINGERYWECSEIFYPKKGREKETSNNVAEYSGFLAIIDYLIGNNLTANSITICGDSRLVIEQMRGKWRMKSGFYIPIALQAKEKLKGFKRKPVLKWIPREQNGIADELSKAKLKKAGIEFKIQQEGPPAAPGK